MTAKLRAVATLLAAAILIPLCQDTYAQNGPVKNAPVIDREFSGDAAAVIRDFNEVFANLSKSLSKPITGPIDEGMARKVIALHQAAIDLGQIILARGTDPELRRIAVGGIQSEAKAISNIRTWLNNRELATGTNLLESPDHDAQ
jgi:hypothetical protein